MDGDTTPPYGLAMNLQHIKGVQNQIVKITTEKENVSVYRETKIT